MTTVIVRKETRKRGFFGKIFKALFYLFNIIMVAWLVAYVKMTHDAAAQANVSDLAAAGVQSIGVGVISICWLIGDAILGALVLATRGAKVIVEERREG
jgi:hypothetical protein